MTKGYKREREFADLLKQAGWITYRPATVRYGENDVWGLFDVLALDPRSATLSAWQVKSNRATGLESWSRQTALWRRAGMLTGYAVPYDREGWRLIAVTGPEDWDDVVDERGRDVDMGNDVVEHFGGCDDRDD